jgi:O-antigen/teichoic acid export membrane protein
MSLRNNTLWNLAGSGLPLIAAAALIPFMLQRLGNEAFGVLTLIWALIGYFSLLTWVWGGRSLTN